MIKTSRLGPKPSTLGTCSTYRPLCLKKRNHTKVSTEIPLPHNSESKALLRMPGSHNGFRGMNATQDQPRYRRCTGTGQWWSSAPLGTPRGTACRIPVDQGPSPRWAGSVLWSLQSSLKRKRHTQSELWAVASREPLLGHRAWPRMGPGNT